MTEEKGKKRMSYQALYRKWRPRIFADVVGQSHITQTLQNAISENKFTHAYLFSGPRGTGKTSAAKIFAQTINCERMPAREPCNECAACLGILDGSIQDVIEIDAASNTSVDDIRDIRENVKYATSAVPYKVYIIDEVHMISTSAFNALLKTLEEPPAHVVFVLATTEPHKIPLTVISRCQRFDFKPISNRTIAGRIDTIMDAEELQITREALDAVSLAAEGGMRDALSLLDQAISYSDGEVELNDVLAVTGGVSQRVLAEMIDVMYEENLQETLGQFDALIQNGKNPGRFVFDCIYFLRDLLFYKTTPELADYLERATVDEFFQSLADKVDADWVQYAMMEFTKCEQQIKWSNSPKVFIEVTLLSIAQRFEMKQENMSNQTVEEIAQLTNQLAQLQKDLQQLREKGVPSAVQEEAQPARKQTQRKMSNSQYKVPQEALRMILDQAEKAALQQAVSQWPVFLEQLKGTNPPAHATIQDSKPVAASTDKIVVAFRFDIHCTLVQEHQSLIEQILERVLGKTVTIFPVPDASWLKIREDYFLTKQAEEPQEEKEEAEVVEKAKQLFGEDFVEVQE